jgi:hypothetical protein
MRRLITETRMHEKHRYHVASGFRSFFISATDRPISFHHHRNSMTEALSKNFPQMSDRENDNIQASASAFDWQKELAHQS